MAVPMRLLAIDLGTQTGICRWLQDGDRYEVAKWDLSFHGAEPWRKWDGYAKRLTQEIDTFQPTLIAYEEPFAGGENQRRSSLILNGLQAFTETIAYRRDILFRAIAPNSIKVAVLGWASRKNAETGAKEFATPKQVLEAVREKLTIPIETHDQAIAVGIAMMISAELTGLPVAPAPKPKPKPRSAAKVIALPTSAVRVRGRAKASA